jgi:hypothetical protein
LLSIFGRGTFSSVGFSLFVLLPPKAKEIYFFQLLETGLSFSSFLSFSPRMIVLNPMAANGYSLYGAPSRTENQRSIIR